MTSQDYTQINPDNIPTLDSWEPFGIVEVETPEDFFELPHNEHGELLGNITGIICPIPDTIELDQYTIDIFFKAVKKSVFFESHLTKYNDIINQARLDGRRGYSVGEIDLPKKLMDLRHMLLETFDRAIKHTPRSFSGVRINSNSHRPISEHEPAALMSLYGKTTILFAKDEEDNLIGKKELPDKSLAVFTGPHCAPDFTPPETRMNILCS